MDVVDSNPCMDVADPDPCMDVAKSMYGSPCNGEWKSKGKEAL